MKTDQEKIDKYLTDAIDYMKNAYFGVRNNFERLGKEIVSLDKAKERIFNLSKKLDIKNFSNIKILEVGSGFGLTIHELAKKGTICYAVEPDKQSFKISNKINAKFINEKKIFIKNTIGEKLPFKKNQFNYVISFQVLEHVKNPEKVIKESLRVLKPGGYLYFVIPNYNSFWEGHYEVIWLPNLLNYKNLAKIYLKLVYRKKNLKFLNELNNITPKYLKTIIEKFNNVKLISLGENEFLSRLKDNNYNPKWGGTSKLISIKNIITKLGISTFIGKLFIRNEWFLPIILIVKKNA